MNISERLLEIYELLLKRFSYQEWWPGETRFEIIVGAILTQNTNWRNVEKAINNLKKADMLSPERMQACPQDALAELIRPAGYYNIKAKRIKSFLNWLFENYAGSLEALEGYSKYALREELLQIKGVGRETADSILLYGFEKPSFVVDAYTARIFIRHGFIDEFADYDQIKELFEGGLPEDTQLYNEYHALIVQLGKQYCKKKPSCSGCPLEHLPHEVEMF